MKALRITLVAALLVAITLTAFVGCKKDAGESATAAAPAAAKEAPAKATAAAPSTGYADGVYYAYDDELPSSGWISYVVLTVKGGKITDVNWSGYNRDGQEKKAYDAAGLYGMDDWTGQAAKMEAYLIEIQDPSAMTYTDNEGHTDAVAGVSIHVNGMFELAEKALAEGPKAKGSYEDGGYWAVGEDFSNGWAEYVALSVVNGKIGDIYWSGYNEEDGSDKRVYDKEGNYNMKEYGGSLGHWWEEADKAEAYLIKTQDPSAITYTDDEGHTDDIAGVTIHVNALFELVADALAAGPVTL